MPLRSLQCFHSSSGKRKNSQLGGGSDTWYCLGHPGCWDSLPTRLVLCHCCFLTSWKIFFIIIIFWSHQLQRGKEATIHLRNNKNHVCYKQKTQKMEMTMEKKLLYLQFVSLMVRINESYLEQMYGEKHSVPLTMPVYHMKGE